MNCDALGGGLVAGLLGAVVLLASGCTTGPSSQLTELKNSGFMSLWNTYADCQSTSDLTQATSDLTQLRSASQEVSEGFILPLPTHLERLVANPTSRVAVDVEAMAAACALHTGELALNQGQTDIARDLLVSVIKLHKEESSYYVLKAKTLLAKLGPGINVSFNVR
jgi:transposase